MKGGGGKYAGGGKNGLGHFYPPGDKNGLEGVRMAWAIFTLGLRMGQAIFTLGGKNGLDYVQNVRLKNIPALVRIMAWRRPGDK